MVNFFWSLLFSLRFLTKSLQKTRKKRGLLNSTLDGMHLFWPGGLVNWFEMYAKGHHGYPQPEDNYEDFLYESDCRRCGLHGQQSGPLRLRKSTKAQHSDFLQPNWVFDVFLIRSELETLLIAEGFTGISFRPVIEHRSNAEFANLRQLSIHQVISCAETSRLPKVTCKANNEESDWDPPGAKRYPPETPFCGQIKSHPPTSLSINSASLSEAPDIFLTGEWFGSGGSAHRMVISSERFVTFVTGKKLRGVGFNPIKLSGHSERAT